MPLPKFYKVCQDQQGNIVPQVLCSVYFQGTGVLAPLYQDDAGAVPLANPMTSDATYGSFKFYINPGHFDLSFTKPGYTFEPIYDMQVPEDTVTLGTMAYQNATGVAITGGTATFTGGGQALAVSGTTFLGDTGIGAPAVPGTALAVTGTTYLGRTGIGSAPPSAPLLLHVGSAAYGLTVDTSNNVGIHSAPVAGTAFAVNGVSYLGTTGIGVVPDATYVLKAGGSTGLGLVVTPDNRVGIQTAPQIGFTLSVQGAEIVDTLSVLTGNTTYTCEVNGTLGIPGGAAAIVNTTSTQALKADVRPLTGAVQALKALAGKVWRWRDDPRVPQTPPPPVGFVMEEVAAVRPEWVTTAADGRQGLQMTGLDAYLVEAIKEISARLEALEARRGA